MAEFTEEFYYEYPDGYEPARFKEPEVRSLEELRQDLTSDPADWQDDLLATLTEMYLPAEDLYDEEEMLRKLRFRIEDPDDDSPFTKEELELELEMLTKTFEAGHAIAQEQMREALDEEMRLHALAVYGVLESSADYEPQEEKDLLEGYEPAPEDPTVSQATRDLAESLRKLSYQIDRLEEDEDLLKMRGLYPIREGIPEEIDGFALTPEDQELIRRDIAHKEDLNRRFRLRTELEDEFISISENLLQDENLWLAADAGPTLEDWDAVDEARQERLNDRAMRGLAA